MKVTINIDCSPEEARTFFGLPDIKGVQDEMMKQMVDRMKGGFTDRDMAELMKMICSWPYKSDSSVHSPRWQ